MNSIVHPIMMALVKTVYMCFMKSHVYMYNIHTLYS